ncbi:TIGR04086 family membrane protein [Sediminibacillus halophilus]|uniref:Putative membrane protein, TIGR04086 family n=1 Tax=Sediminibacillus halophilus TaxID=482461 RepID=A0A1G9XRG5_9BACI|nr:TIGR04086 family membrane protein [Sediminibacillus halophilus]SDM99358.1 putative membrane protein, TIGR04086 family [Sediminibacillus halophilus]
MARARLTALLYGWITALGIILAASLILSILLKFTSFGEAALNWTTIAVSIAALFIGGLISGLKGKEKGWILGCLTGLGFILFILLYQYLGYRTGIRLEQLVHYGGFLAASVIGGMLGVNLSSESNDSK